MKRRKFITCLAGTAALGWTAWKLGGPHANGFASPGDLVKIKRSTRALGTSVTLTLYHHDQTEAEAAIAAAFLEIDRVEGLMSLYRPDSQICRLNRDGVLANPHPYLVEVLETARDLSEQTDGAFDITVQPLWSLYSGQNEPDATALREAVTRVDWKRVAISPHEVRIAGRNTEITLNGIAQGYASDAVQRVLVAHGIQSALIDTGEIGTIGRADTDRDWTVGIKHPRQPASFLGLAALENRSLATSGDYETRFSDDFSRHHLIDPHTGQSPTELSSVSIVAPTALQADALSTATFVLGLDKGRQLVEETPGTDALFVSKEGRQVQTTGFPILS